jgi:hypothetical protein
MTFGRKPAAGENIGRLAVEPLDGDDAKGNTCQETTSGSVKETRT